MRDGDHVIEYFVTRLIPTPNWDIITSITKAMNLEYGQVITPI